METSTLNAPGSPGRVTLSPAISHEIILEHTARRVFTVATAQELTELLRDNGGHQLAFIRFGNAYLPLPQYLRNRGLLAEQSTTQQIEAAIGHLFVGPGCDQPA